MNDEPMIPPLSWPNPWEEDLDDDDDEYDEETFDDDGHADDPVFMIEIIDG